MYCTGTELTGEEAFRVVKGWHNPDGDKAAQFQPHSSESDWLGTLQGRVSCCVDLALSLEGMRGEFGCEYA